MHARTRMVEGDSHFVALSWSPLPPPRTLEEADAAAAADLGVLAAVDHPRRLPGPPVAQLPAAQRADPQGPDLRPDRRAARRGHHVAARDAAAASATGTTATPGCATRPSRCGACTRSASTARPTTSSTSSPTSAATATTCR